MSIVGVGIDLVSIPDFAEQVDQPGTYWYHSHERGQYPDGLRGALIVHDPENPHKDLYDEEIVLTFSDWYHDLMQDLLKGFISISNPSGAEPLPQAALVNDTQNLTVKIQPGKTYMFRLINMGAFAAQYVWFEGHGMRVVEVDGVYTEPMDAEMLYVAAAQRYSVLVTAKNDTSSNFAFVGSMDQVPTHDVSTALCMPHTHLSRISLTSFPTVSIPTSPVGLCTTTQHRSPLRKMCRNSSPLTTLISCRSTRKHSSTTSINRLR